MKTCLLCGRETTGSVGVAGLRWPSLCQRCKDAEDVGIEYSLAATSTAVNRVYDVLSEGDTK